MEGRGVVERRKGGGERNLNACGRKEAENMGGTERWRKEGVGAVFFSLVTFQTFH